MLESRVAKYEEAAMEANEDGDALAADVGAKAAARTAELEANSHLSRRHTCSCTRITRLSMATMRK